MYRLPAAGGAAACFVLYRTNNIRPALVGHRALFWMDSSFSADENRMADAGVPSRAERKALEKAKILQRESEREVFRRVRWGNTMFGASRAKLMTKTAYCLSGVSLGVWPGVCHLMWPAGRTGPEETRGWAFRGGDRGAAAAQRHRGGAVQETSPQKCAEEEAGGGERDGWVNDDHVKRYSYWLNDQRQSWFVLSWTLDKYTSDVIKSCWLYGLHHTLLEFCIQGWTLWRAAGKDILWALTPPSTFILISALWLLL